MGSFVLGERAGMVGRERRVLHGGEACAARLVRSLLVGPLPALPKGESSPVGGLLFIFRRDTSTLAPQHQPSNN